MSLKTSLVVAMALAVTPGIGCKTRSNTTEQNQSNSLSGSPPPSAAGSDTNPNLPNPTNAATGEPMGPPRTGVAGPGVTIDAGVREEKKPARARRRPTAKP